MYVVFVETSGAGRDPVPTAHMSVKLDVAKERADKVAKQMPDVVKVTVRHHKRTGEVYYSIRGECERLAIICSVGIVVVCHDCCHRVSQWNDGDSCCKRGH